MTNKEQALEALHKALATAKGMPVTLDGETLIVQLTFAGRMVAALDELKRPRRKGAAKKKAEVPA